MAEHNGFPMVPLGEISTPIERLEEVQPDQMYRQLGVSLWGAGAYERERLVV